MEKIGGAYMNTNDSYWTSTQYTATSAWTAHLGYGGSGAFSKDNRLDVRPVCSI